jgi:hypothetical protein
MKLSIPKTDSRVIFPMVGYGIILLVWLSMEDNGTVSVALLGTGAAVLYSSSWLLKRSAGQVLPLRVWLPGLILFGGTLGALSTLTTTLLMFFKTGWHGHGFPDYPPQMLLAMLQRLPVWTLAGALIGLAAALIKLSHAPYEQTVSK